MHEQIFAAGVSLIEEVSKFLQRVRRAHGARVVDRWLHRCLCGCCGTAVISSILLSKLLADAFLIGHLSSRIPLGGLDQLVLLRQHLHQLLLHALSFLRELAIVLLQRGVLALQGNAFLFLSLEKPEFLAILLREFLFQVDAESAHLFEIFLELESERSRAIQLFARFLELGFALRIVVMIPLPEQVIVGWPF